MHNLQDAYRAARQHGFHAAQAITVARNRLANLAPAESRLDAARAAAFAVVDKRRFAPENVAAQTELRAAQHAVSEISRSIRPRDSGSHSRTLGAAFPIGGYETAPGQWCENPPFRFVGLAGDIAGIGHTGWYVGGFQDETARGVVYQATAKNGCARYIPAIADPYNSAKDGSGRAVLALADMVTADSADESDSEDARKDAARRADQLAEYFAESERDYQEAYSAGSRYVELGAEIVEARREILEALAERRRVPAADVPTLCAMLRRNVGALLESIREARETREDLASDYGSDAAFRHALADG